MFPAAPTPLPLSLSLQHASGAADNVENDPAASQRESDPLTAKSLLDTLNASSPNLRRMTQYQMAAALIFRRLFAFTTGLFLCDLAGVTASSLLQRGLVPTLQLTVGSVVFLYWVLYTWVLSGLSARFRARHQSNNMKQNDLGAHPLANVARWLQLVTLPSKSEDSHFGLLLHYSTDPWCPCPAQSCAGTVVRNVLRVRIIEMAGPGIPNTLAVFFVFWTGFSAPTAFSTQWWGGFICIVCFCYHLFYIGLGMMSRTASNIASLRLSLRLHRRAVYICLSGLLERYQTSLPSDAGTAPWEREIEEPYLTLLPALAQAWETRFPIPVSGGPVLFLYGGNFIIVAIANVAAGGCIPLYSLMFFLFGFILLIQDLANFSAANAQITAVTRLVTDCRREIRLLLVRASNQEPSGALAVWKERLERHLTMLGSFENPDAYQAKFLGYPINYGVLRTVLVTAFTIGVGLWTLLRGAGVRLSLLYACPVPIG